MTTAPTYDRSDQPYEELSRAEMRAWLDDRARRQFGMSLEEFTAAADRGEFDDEPQAEALMMLLRDA